jgi:tetrahydromethanopterin S-methyltransferase subunit B
MEFTRSFTVTINIGDVVGCLTADGWEAGVVTKVTEDIITVHMDYIDEEREFTIDLIR